MPRNLPRPALLRPAPLVGFFLRAIVFYALLALPWPGVVAAYGAIYRLGANIVFGHLPGGGRVQFGPAAPGSRMDSEITLQSRLDPAFRGTTPHDSRITGYLPTAELLAFVLASPVPWPRRRRAAVMGLAAVHLFIALRLGVTLLHWYTGNASWSLYRVGPEWDRLIERLFEVLAVAPILTYVAPVFIWIAVTFRAEDRELLRPTTHGGSGVVP